MGLDKDQGASRQQRLERTLRTLSNGLSAVIHITDEQKLLEEICRIAVNTGGYAFAWIGYAQDDAARTVRPMAHAGFHAGYLQEITVSWAEDALGQGPVGRAIRSRSPEFSRQIASDQLFAPWRKTALKHGFQAVGALPLLVEGSVLGSLNLYSRLDTFDQEEIELLTSLADNLAFGIQAIRIRIQRDEQEALMRNNQQLLQERVKELDLLLSISQIRNQEDLSLLEILEWIAKVLPSAWRFPELAAARVAVYEYGEFKTDGFRPSPYSLKSVLQAGDRDIGEIEVVYLEEPPVQDNSVFLPEEKDLLQSVSAQTADIVQHCQTVVELRKLSGALEQAADTVVITDTEGKIEYVNHAFEEVTGYPRAEALGRKPNILKSGQHPPEFYTHMWETILKGEVYRDTVINRTRDGTLYYEQKTISPLFDQQGRLTHFLATGKDLTEQLRTESRLQYLTRNDALTGLMNQKEFIRHVDQVLRDEASRIESLAVVAIGLDSFKFVNETFGRYQGDQVLKMMGERLSRAVDMPVARIGSDEFCFMLKGKAAKQPEAIVYESLDALAQPFSIQEEELVLTASAGISCYPLDSREGLVLLQKAETAMSRAKTSGIQRFEFYTPDMQVNSVHRLRLNKALLEALEKSQFSLYFQPQIDLTSNLISGVEALVRWEPPGLPAVSPQEFIPLLEDMGRISELGDFVIQEACDAYQRINKAGLDLPQISINLAAPQLEDPLLVRKLTRALDRAGLEAHNLELEITESLLISQFEKVQDNLAELRKLGTGVALDDFGTGYSSLQYLTRYPFSKLKIDKAFIWSMALNSKDYEVVKAIISLGHSLGIRVVAEGVEKKKHVQVLLDLGCRYCQGYLFSPPLEEKAFMSYVKTFTRDFSP